MNNTIANKPVARETFEEERNYAQPHFGNKNKNNDQNSSPEFYQHKNFNYQE